MTISSTPLVLSITPSGGVMDSRYSAGRPPEWVFFDMPPANQGQAFSFNVAPYFVYATAPVTFSITSGALPTGLTMSSAGVISGTTNVTVGGYDFTVRGVAANGTVDNPLIINVFGQTAGFTPQGGYDVSWSGQFGHGVPYLVLGTGFGAKTGHGAGPLVYDNGNEASLVSAGWSDGWPNTITGENSTANIAMRDTPFTRSIGVGAQPIAGPYARVKRLMAGGACSNQGATGGYNVMPYVAFPPPAATDYMSYLTWYERADPQFPFGAVPFSRFVGTVTVGSATITAVDDSLSYINVGAFVCPPEFPIGSKLLSKTGGGTTNATLVVDAQALINSSTFGIGDANYKIWDWSGNSPYDAGTPNNNWYGSAQNPTAPSNALWGINDDGGFDGGPASTITMPGFNGASQYGPAFGALTAWHKFEVYYWHAEWPTGEIYVIIDNDLSKVWHYVGKTQDPYNGANRSMSAGGYTRDSGYATAWRYFSGAYGDLGEGWFFLTNNASWAASTIREVQPWSAWASGQVSLEANLGALPDGSTMYLHFRNAPWNPVGNAYLGFFS